VNESDKLLFHVNSSEDDVNIEICIHNNVFTLAKGYATIDAEMQKAITFESREIAHIDNIATNANMTLPAHANFRLIRSTTNAEVQAAAAMLIFNVEQSRHFEQVNSNLYKLTSSCANQIFSKEIISSPNWNEALDLCVFDDSNISSLFLGTGANTLVINTLAERMTSVNGCRADLFVHALYNHAHQDEIEGIGDNSNMGSFIIEMDNVWTLSNERYFRLGPSFRHVHGKTNFFGSATGLEKSAKQDACLATLFGRYKSFNDKNLKIKIGATRGYCHGKDSLRRTDPDYKMSMARFDQMAPSWDWNSSKTSPRTKGPILACSLEQTTVALPRKGRMSLRARQWARSMFLPSIIISLRPSAVSTSKRKSSI
jgi:hypothetical protein